MDGVIVVTDDERDLRNEGWLMVDELMMMMNIHV